jgi:diguanylate cyclase (GGDEF)-like protein/PAS domain S-box-containing protein
MHHMIEKKRIVSTTNLSFRSVLLLIIILPVLVLWVASALMAGTVKAAFLGGVGVLLFFFCAWLLGETLLIRQFNRLDLALRRLAHEVCPGKLLPDGLGHGIEALTEHVDQITSGVESLCHDQLQEIEALKQSQKKWTDILNSLPDAAFVIDHTGTVIVWNHAIEDLTGVQAAEMIGKKDREYAVPFYGDKRNLLIDYIFLSPDEITGKYHSVKRVGNRLYGEGIIMAHRSEKPIYFWAMASPLYDDTGQLVGAIETIRDVSEYKETEKALLDGRAKYQALFDSANDAVTLMINDKFIDCNQKALNLFGCTKETFIGQTPQRFSPTLQPDGQNSAQAALEKITGALQGAPQFFAWTHCRLDGQPFDTEISLDAVKLENGEVIIQSIIRDITERKQAEETIRQFAYHDTLTGLPNRRLLYDRFNLEIVNAARGKRTFAIMMFDIDHFKSINDNLGHHTGDLLLQNVAYRIKSNLRKGDTLARFGGDEFIVLLPEVTRNDEADTIGRKLLRAFKRPFSCAEHDVFITTSIGIALYPSDGQDMETLIRHADRALYQAKDDGRNTCAFYSAISQEEIFGTAEKPVPLEDSQKDFLSSRSPIAEMGYSERQDPD